MAKTKKTVVIKTKKWCRDAYKNDNGSCCALGFAGKALHNNAEYYASHSLTDLKNQRLNSEIIEANDELRGEERRKKLEYLFKSAGLKLQFV